MRVTRLKCTILCLALGGWVVAAAHGAESKTDSEMPKRMPSAANPASTVEPEGGQLFRILGSSLFAASGADLATTEWGLSRYDVREGNPLAANRGVRIATHVIGPAAVYWTTEKIHRSGHRNLALALRIGVMVAYSYAALHNVRQIARSAPR